MNEAHDLSSLGEWASLPFFAKRWPDLSAYLAAQAPDALPPSHLRFAALERTPPDAVRVVILGQDPYPTPGHANGLAFSVTTGTPLPKSLANIYRELKDDMGAHPPTGDLGGWADQGVLLLNTSLSTPPRNAGGHARLGWSDLTTQVLDRLSDRPRAELLWGTHARKVGAPMKNQGHFVLESPHPSPLSAYRGFFGSKPFSRINTWLTKQEQEPIDWARPAS